MDYKEQARIWTKRLSTYHAPEAFSRVAQASSEVPDSRFFNDSRFNPLREAWAAGQFAQAIQRRRNAEVLVRLEEGEFPDFVLKIGDRELPFEVTETMRPERKRGKEYKDREKDPLLLTPYRPAEGEQEGPSWIGESVRKKHEKSYGPKPHLLVYHSAERKQHGHRPDR